MLSTKFDHERLYAMEKSVTNYPTGELKSIFKAFLLRRVHSKGKNKDAITSCYYYLFLYRLIKGKTMSLCKLAQVLKKNNKVILTIDTEKIR